MDGRRVRRRREYPSEWGLATGNEKGLNWVTQRHTWTTGLISVSGGNFDNFIWQHVNGQNGATWQLANKLLVNEIIEIPTTSRNQTYCPCVLAVAVVYTLHPRTQCTDRTA